MIDTKNTSLLYIEPTGAPSAEPVIDDLTRRLTAAWRERIENNDATRGWHACTGAGCTATSTNCTYQVGGINTHSLAIHYLAHHREEVPDVELDKIAGLRDEQADPTSGELMARGPSAVGAALVAAPTVKGSAPVIAVLTRHGCVPSPGLRQVMGEGSESALAAAAADIRALGYEVVVDPRWIWVDLHVTGVQLAPGTRRSDNWR